jgi:hypothetical protein
MLYRKAHPIPPCSRRLRAPPAHGDFLALNPPAPGRTSNKIGINPAFGGSSGIFTGAE